jgi:hypothetical protein
MEDLVRDAGDPVLDLRSVRLDRGGAVARRLTRIRSARLTGLECPHRGRQTTPRLLPYFLEGRLTLGACLSARSQGGMQTVGTEADGRARRVSAQVGRR